MGSTGGWNRPASNQPVKKGGAKAPFKVKGVIVGAIAVVIGVVCLWMFSGGEDVPKAKADKERGKIKEVTPAAAPKAEPIEVKEEPPKDPRINYRPEDVYRDDRGILRFKGSDCRAFDPNRPHLPPTGADKFYVTVFSNRCDRAIAGLLSQEPGTPVFLRGDYSDPSFKEAFMASITEPIRINDDDSEYHKQLKQAVIETRKEIAKRIGDGEELGQILTDAKKELERLAAYRRDLDGEIAKMVKDSDGMSTEDVKTLVEAANKMLEENGVLPIEADQFVEWNLRLSATREGADPDEAVRAYQEQEELKNAQKEEQDNEQQ